MSLRQDDLHELLQACAELRARLRAGETTRVEDVLESHPSLASNDEAVLELIHVEFVTRNDLGQNLTLKEWQERFPRLLPRMETIVSLRGVFGSEMPTLSDSTAGQENPLVSVQGPGGRLPRIGNYQLLQEIGRGGMGVVYKARQTSLSRIVALKMILAGEHAGMRERARLRNEAEAAAQLLHSNVVQIFEIGEHEGLPFLAMEYVPGGNLTRMLRGMPQAFRWSARLTETLARAIHVAHRRGIVHRDLNPSNILIAQDGTPKITDFGLAKFLVNDQGLSLNGVMLGTPSYMAPEQVSSNGKSVGPSTDVYALAALLYEMLTGTAPYRGFTPMETLCQVMEAELVPPSRLRHGVPEDLETICLKCLDRDPARRVRHRGGTRRGSPAVQREPADPGPSHIANPPGDAVDSPPAPGCKPSGPQPPLVSHAAGRRRRVQPLHDGKEQRAGAPVIPGNQAEKRDVDRAPTVSR